MGKGMKTLNDYAIFLSKHSYDETPKAVYAAIALSFAVRLSENEDFDKAVDLLNEEWRILYDNGIISQKPINIADAKTRQKANNIDRKFNFWRSNKINAHFQLTEKELVAKYSAWLKTKPVAWLQSNMNTIGCFISANEPMALNSTCEIGEEFEMMVELLQPVLKDFLINIDKPFIINN